ncbi:hypothetical protein [Bradyrhizobium diazoefficiens]|uniref:hypothetical protein n=1 Tax=Bradyrhizobium diazoefficiens TaxID=1355477 RepID=UPI0034918FAF
MIVLATVLHLVVLHAVDGREVYINPNAVTNLQDARQDADPTKRTARGVACIISLSDGKFVGVAEPCETVREQLERQ